MYLSNAKNYGYPKKAQLKKQEVKIWHSFTERGEYQGADPSYFDVSSFDWYSILKNNTDVFKKEVLEATGEIFIPYYNRTFSNTPESWKIIPLFSWLKRFDSNLAKMPKSKNILSQSACDSHFVKAINFEIQPELFEFIEEIEINSVAE